MNGRDIWVENVYCNSTAKDQPEGENWVQNTDGFGIPYPLHPP